ncbi:MAG: EMC3/TMCO1 family protein [Candidatus Bathyarchaeia archaeon]
MIPEWLSAPPASTLFILCITALLQFVVSFTNSRLTDREQLSAWRRDIAAFNKLKVEAMRSKDKKLLAKVEKQQPRIMKLQSKMFQQSMKTSAIFMGPFLLIWSYLTGVINFLQLFMFFIFLFMGLYFTGRFSARKLIIAFILIVVPVFMGLYFTGRYPDWVLFESPYVRGPMAFLPWFGEELTLNLFLWYLVCSLLCGALFSRLFGLATGMGEAE